MSIAGRRGDGAQLERRLTRNGPAQGPLHLVTTKPACARTAGTCK